MLIGNLYWEGIKVSNFKLVRIDSRLIHGQVITKWLKRVDAEKIIIIDNALANDEFMKSIYVMAAPSHVIVEVYTEEDGMQKWNDNKFENSSVLMLFKDITTIYNMIKRGMPLGKIQIGGLGAGPDRKKAYGPIYLSQEDFKMLKELYDEKIEIVLHQVPDEPALEFSKIISKFE